MFDGNPRELVIAALCVLGALTVLAELVGGLDRLRMAAQTSREIADLPTFEEGSTEA